MVVLTFDLELGSIWHIIPKGVMLRLTGHTRPNYLGALQGVAARMLREDP